MKGRLLLCAILAAGLSRHPTASPDQELTLTAVLARAGDYVVRFEHDLSGLVAEEHYTQDVERVDTLGHGRADHVTREAHRETQSDLLLVRAEDGARYVQFRDTFEVDGEPVRDRSDRLLDLFVHPSATGDEQIGRILDEGARYNIGNIQRNINVPVVALTFLHPENRHRFKFGVKSRGGEGLKDLPTSATFAVSTQVWVVDFRETDSPTFVRGRAGSDLPSHGRFWIEPTTGRILMSELVTESRDVHGQITVNYQSQPLAGLLVPIEMHESYWQKDDAFRTNASAIYTNFRRFQVEVNETIRIPPAR